MCHQLYLHSVEANRVAHARGRRACHLLVAAQTYSDVTRLLEIGGGRGTLQRAVGDADALFVLSEQSREELLAVGADPRRIHDYRYFVDVARFAPDGERPARELLCLGRWHPQKNLPLLLDAFERLGARVPDIRLRIVGAGPAEDAMRARVARLPFADRVRIQGWASDPVPLYRRAWALVMSSDAEGLSNVMIEAMACGTPVVTTDVSGAREALDLRGEGRHPLPAHGYLRGAGGLLVPRGNVEVLTSALEAVVTTPALRDELSGLARTRAVTEFSEDTCVEGFLERLDA
jgi:glycosyltransferase involved in cell wall biosynthesis